MALAAAGALVVLAVVAGAVIATGPGTGSSKKGLAPAATTAATPAPAPAPTLPSGPPQAPVTTVAEPATTATTAPAQAFVAALAGNIAQSEAVRPTVQNAINGVEECSVSPAQGEQILGEAINTRQDIITALPNVPVADVPRGQQLVAALSAALKASVTADQDYERYMGDFESDNYACNSSPTVDSYYNQGQTDSQQATADKNTFDALWNPIAATYGEQPVTSTEY